MFGGEGGNVGAMGATVRDVDLALPAAAKASTFDLMATETEASWLILPHIPLAIPCCEVLLFKAL